MPAQTAREIAPRLYRALEAERAYQRRKVAWRKLGIMPGDVMAEEMVRSMRLLARWCHGQQQIMVRQMTEFAKATAAMRKLQDMMVRPDVEHARAMSD
jgi:hypothetical protein